MKKTFALQLVVIGLLCCRSTAAQPVPLCVPQKIDQALLNNDLDLALKATEECIVWRRRDLAEAEQKYKGKPVDLVDVIGMAEVGTSAVLIAKVEILALRGEVQKVDAAVSDAELFARQHPDANLNSTLGRVRFGCGSCVGTREEG